MEKSIKIIIGFLVILVLVSCNSIEKLSSIKFTESKPSVTFIDDGKNVHKGLDYIDMYIKVSPKEVMSESAISEWAEYVESEMGVYINLKYCFEPQFDTREFRNVEKVGTIFDGNIFEIAKLSYLDYLQNINNYININRYPLDVKNIVTDIYGDIWVLPTYHEKEYKYRTYDKDILEEFNMDVPTTVDEFYNLAIAIKQYNENSDKKVYISTFTNINILDEFADIFIAFGCYVDYNLFGLKASSIAYNPNIDQFEYILNNENVKEAIKFIKLLYDEDLIYYNKTRELSDDISIASYYTNANNINYDNKSYGLYLEGISNKNLVYCTDIVGGISFLYNTSEVDKIVSFYENMVFTEKNAQLIFNYGIESEGFYTKDNVLYINKDYMNDPNIKIEWYDEFDDTKMTIGETIIEKENTEKEKIEAIVNNISKDIIYRPHMIVDYKSFYNYALDNKKGINIANANFYLCGSIINILYGDDIEYTLKVERDKLANKFDMETINSFIKNRD